ncbi:conserved hypothetical protein [Desulfamplus magnetovallimortis]|uniref:ACT domain-containing protein n=1 Tax=Desulfamplus magnetovallimortis TaxID=1246637 RepID=A0A1W1H7X6_9BACT|nr:ACT domain-containing protein [Desulfamplus magnetovallimortis]SLM28577.1 conserved hypothetical protein [Desulfamplus magnetovallimortis]
MDKLIITVLGKDKPGIVASVAKSLYQMDCNIQNVNQMILQNEFAGFFVIDHPPELDMEKITSRLTKDLEGKKLQVYIDELASPANGLSNGYEIDSGSEETFLITTIGPDQKGLVAKFTEIIAEFNVNITNLKAVFKGGDEPSANIMNYQVAILPDTDQAGLFKRLRAKAAELGLDISIQHKNIFETINKI